MTEQEITHHMIEKPSRIGAADGGCDRTRSPS